MRVLIAILIAIAANSNELNYKEAKELFIKKCSSCHKYFIEPKKILKNFFKMDNRLLKLKAPTANMINYAMTKGAKKIGDPNDKEMQIIEVEEFLREYLKKPNRNNSICDPKVLKYFDKKMPIKDKLSDKEYELLAYFFINYKAPKSKNYINIKELNSTYSLKDAINEANKNSKLLLVEISSDYCPFCKKMKKIINNSSKIKELLNKNYLYVRLNIDKEEIPPLLKRQYKKIIPSFFILKQDKVIGSYPGSWSKEDFIEILKENLKER